MRIARLRAAVVSVCVCIGDGRDMIGIMALIHCCWRVCSWCPPADAAAAAAAAADTSLRTMTLMKGHVCSLELFLLQNFSVSCVRQLFWAANQ